MHSLGDSVASGRVRQKRSQKTYEALIATCFKMLEQREFDEISVADLARRAGYSVGAFYARFQSKDELFDALVERHMRDRAATREQLFAVTPDEALIGELIAEMVHYYWERRRFWRAALVRSIRDPDFWEPIRKQGHQLTALLIQRMSARARRPLSEAEETNVTFAVQIALGTINNAIFNRPGPIFIGQALFVENLTRAFRKVSASDDIFARRLASPSKKRGRRRYASRVRR